MATLTWLPHHGGRASGEKPLGRLSGMRSRWILSQPLCAHDTLNLNTNRCRYHKFRHRRNAPACYR
jgi:hypothetical protein